MPAYLITLLIALFFAAIGLAVYFWVEARRDHASLNWSLATFCVALFAAARVISPYLPPPLAVVGSLLEYVSIVGVLTAAFRLFHGERRPLRTTLDAERKRARELDALLTANLALFSTLDLDPLLHNVLSAAITALPAAEKGTILLWNTAANQLQIRAVAGYADPRVRTFGFAGDSGYSARAMREKRPLLIPDARSDPAIRYDGEIPEVRAILSAIVAPLTPIGAHGKAVGVLSLDSTCRSAFTESDLRLLVAFANTAAVAIEHASLHTEVKALAVTDGLTGLSNRRAFDRALEVETARAGRYDHPLALIILDIDSFKTYNDAYGHPAGDERLRAIADLLRSTVREPDVVARYGGEEFALILPHADKAGALNLAERLRAAAEAAAPASPDSGKPNPGFTVSIGVAAFPDDAETPQALVLAADNAELAAKRSGKNRVCPAPSLTPQQR